MLVQPRFLRILRTRMMKAISSVKKSLLTKRRILNKRNPKKVSNLDALGNVFCWEHFLMQEKNHLTICGKTGIIIKALFADVAQW